MVVLRYIKDKDFGTVSVIDDEGWVAGELRGVEDAWIDQNEEKIHIVVNGEAEFESKTVETEGIRKEPTMEEAAEKAEELFRQGVAQRMSAEDLNKEIYGHPSEHVKKVWEAKKTEKLLGIERDIDINKIAAEVISMLYKKSPRKLSYFIETLGEKLGDAFSGEGLAKAMEVLEKRELVQEKFDDSIRPIFNITEKGKKIVQEETEKAEATRRELGIESVKN